jgi:hypothetical protein
MILLLCCKLRGTTLRRNAQQCHADFPQVVIGNCDDIAECKSQKRLRKRGFAI